MIDDDAASATSSRAFRTALGALENSILSGTYRVGDRLPAERDLAAQLKVSRSAVREAIRALSAQGVVEANVGTGPRSGTRVTAQRSEALVRLLELQVAVAQFPVDDVVTARIALERSIGRLAAARRTGDDLATLRRLMEGMYAGEVGIEAFNALDTGFHVAIAEAARSSLVGDLSRAVRLSLARPILDAERRLPDWGSFRASLIRQHGQILDAIDAGDADATADLLEQHTRHSFAALGLTGPQAPR